MTTPAFQGSAFQSTGFQAQGLAAPIPAGSLADLDKGVSTTAVRVWLGPSLGWVQTYVLPENIYTSNVNLTPFDSIALISISSGPANVGLPDVTQWVQAFAYRPYTPFSRSLWIKDYGGFATATPISIFPFGSQTIDTQSSAVISVNFGIVRLYPLSNLAGWFIG